MAENAPGRYAWLWPVALATTIFLASSRSRVAGPEFVNSDKVAHFLAYGLLGSLVARLRGGWRGAGLGLLAASLFGITDEWHQSFVPGRDSSAMDWVADTLGAALAVTLYAGWPRYRRLMETRIGPKRRVENPGPVETLAGP